MTVQKQKLFVSPEAIYKYLLGMDENVDTLISCKNNEVDLITSDQAIYEALGSIENKQDINYFKMVKLLEVVRIISHEERFNSPRKILTEERVQEVRNNAKGTLGAALGTPGTQGIQEKGTQEKEKSLNPDERSAEDEKRDDS